MATHFSILAWRIPGIGEPGGPPSLGSHSRTRLKQLSSSTSSGSVVNNWFVNARDTGSISGLERFCRRGNATHCSFLAWKIPWIEEAGGYSPWDHKESDMIEHSKHTHTHTHTHIHATHFILIVCNNRPFSQICSQRHKVRILFRKLSPVLTFLMYFIYISFKTRVHPILCCVCLYG